MDGGLDGGRVTGGEGGGGEGGGACCTHSSKSDTKSKCESSLALPWLEMHNLYTRGPGRLTDTWPFGASLGVPVGGSLRLAAPSHVAEPDSRNARLSPGRATLPLI